MTNPDSSPTALPDPSLLVIESFIDGEPIDLEALKDALSRPHGREHLADLLALRDAVWAMAPRGFATVERKRTAFDRSVRRFAIAAGVILSLTTGYLAGQETAKAPAESSSVEMMMDAPPAPLPEATRVITLEPGVNWIETPGGR
jgi:hypothetical protein